MNNKIIKIIKFWITKKIIFIISEFNYYVLNYINKLVSQPILSLEFVWDKYCFSQCIIY